MSNASKWSLAAALVCFGLWFLWPRDRSDPDGASGERASPATAQGAIEGGSERNLAPGVAADSTAVSQVLPARAGRGRVLDDLLGLPLAACVRPDVGPALFTRAEDGEFTLDERHRGCRTLRVEEAGFEPVEADAAACFTESGAELRLGARRSASVIVEDLEGRPLPDVAIEWRGLASRAISDGSDGVAAGALAQGRANLTTRTDANGVSEVALGRLAEARVAGPDGAAAQSVCVAPGEQRVVRFGTPMRLSFVDFDTREPLAGLRFSTWAARASDALALAGETDGSGEAWVGAVHGPMLLRLSGSSTFQRELHPLSADAERTGYGGDYKTMLSIPRPIERLAVAVRTCGARVRLRNAATGEPVDARVAIGTWKQECAARVGVRPGACTWESPRCEQGSWRNKYASVGGVLELPCSFYAPDGGAKVAGVSQELVLLAAGYAPARLTVPPEPPRHGEPPLALELEPTLQRRLRVQYPDGRPFTTSVMVYAPSPDVVVWRSAGASDGMHGPFDWFGGELEVLGQRLSAQALEAGELVTLVVPDDTGTIELVGAPPGVSLGDFVARMPPDRESREFTPTLRTDDGCRFERVPPGAYLVGPREWVLACELHALVSGRLDEALKPTSARVVVNPGQVARVEWLPSWRAGRELRGRISWSGEPTPDLVLVPYFALRGFDALGAGQGTPWFPFGRNTPRVPLDRGGEYRIAADEPVPDLIAVCSIETAAWGSSSGLWVIEAIRPGESLQLLRATVVLEWEGEPRPGALRVSCDIPAEKLRYPLNTAHREGRALWDTAAELELRGIPTHVDRLAIGDRMLELAPLSDGERRELRVRFDELPKLTRR